MSIILFLAVLFVLVLVHEWGHFITAKKTGMRVDEFGIGFPPFLGGPFRYLDSLGVQNVVNKLTQLSETVDQKFAPAEILVKMASDQKTFY